MESTITKEIHMVTEGKMREMNGRSWNTYRHMIRVNLRKHTKWNVKDNIKYERKCYWNEDSADGWSHCPPRKWNSQLQQYISWCGQLNFTVKMQHFIL